MERCHIKMKSFCGIFLVVFLLSLNGSNSVEMITDKTVALQTMKDISALEVDDTNGIAKYKEVIDYCVRQ